MTPANGEHDPDLSGSLDDDSAAYTDISDDPAALTFPAATETWLPWDAGPLAPGPP